MASHTTARQSRSSARRYGALRATSIEQGASMLDRLVADGDRTTTGGEVIGRSNQYNEAGKMYARKENHATCGNCKGGWPICGTAGDWMDDGYPMVKDLDWVMCPCGKNRVLAAGSSNAFYSESKGEAATVPPPKALAYDQQYRLMGGDGQPLANVRYRIVTNDGQVLSGATNSAGQTERIITQGSSGLQLQLET